MCKLPKTLFQTAGPAERDAALLANLVAASPAVLYSCKVAEDCGTIAVTSNVQRILGYSPDEFIGDPSFWAVRVHPEDATRVFEEMPHLFRDGEETVEYRFQCADGSYVWIRDHMQLERDEDGQPLRILGSWIVIPDPRAAVHFVTQVLTRDPRTTMTAMAGGKYANQT